MSTKEQEGDDWKKCIEEQKMDTSPHKVVCDKPTVAKYVKISVAGEDTPLYLAEVEVMGFPAKPSEGEYEFFLYKFQELHTVYIVLF